MVVIRKFSLQFYKAKYLVIYELNNSEVLFPYTKPIFVILYARFDNNVVIFWSKFEPLDDKRKF